MMKRVFFSVLTTVLATQNPLWAQSQPPSCSWGAKNCFPFSLWLAQTPQNPTRPLEPLPLPLPTPSAPQPLIPSTPSFPPAQSFSDPDLRVEVKAIEVLGSSVFTPAQLNAVISPYLGQSLTFEELLEIRTAITRLYTERGYTTSGAFLPPQDLSAGTIQIQVVEGQLEGVEITGLWHVREQYVRDRLNLGIATPINLNALETALQLLQLDPNFQQVDAELKAGSRPGFTVLAVHLTETPPFTSAIVLHNKNSPTVGSYGATVELGYSNPLGWGDRLWGSFELTEGIRAYNFNYSLPLNPKNGTLTLRYSNESSRIVEDPFADIDINARSSTFSLGFRQPLILTPDTELALGLSFDARQSNTFLGETPFSFSSGPQDGKSRVSVFRFSQDWINRQPRRILAARSQFSLGVDLFNATRNENSPDGQFFSWLGQFQWVEALSPDLILITRTGVQLTPNTLLPLEKLSIGGLDTVRGYRQNRFAGDNGFFGSVELRFSLFQDTELGSLQLAPFFDFGSTWNTTQQLGNITTLASLGLGVHWELQPYLQLNLDWGIPLTPLEREGITLQDNGLYLSIRWTFS